MTAAAIAGSTMSTAGAAGATPSAVGPVPHAPVFTGMTPTRIIAGPSLAPLSAWGLAYNATTGDVLVTDYAAKVVRRYDESGDFLGNFGAGGGSVGPPGPIAVDPRDGSVYVGILTNAGTYIRKYSATGTYLYQVYEAADSPWLTVDSEGTLWITAWRSPHIYGMTMGATTASATVTTTITVPGAKELLGIATDAAGNIYAGDSQAHTISSFTPTGALRWQYTNATVFPGDMRGLVVDDSTGELYVADSQAGTVAVLSLTGGYLRSFGSMGDGPGQFGDGPRGLAITPDGTLFAADYSNDRVETFQLDGTYLSAFPSPAAGRDALGLAKPRGVAVDPNSGDVYITDSWGERILTTAADGTLLNSFGQRGSFPDSNVNYPLGIAVDSSTDDVWVANGQTAPEVVEYNSAMTTALLQIKSVQYVNGIAVSGGQVYTLPRLSSSLVVFDASSGAQVATYKSTKGPFGGVAVDPSTGDVYLSLLSSPGYEVLSPSLQLLASVSAAAPGWGIALTGGDVYMSEPSVGQIQVFDQGSGTSLGVLGTKGAGFGQLGAPSALSVDSAGDLYVAEYNNDRVQVFAPVPKPTSKVAPVVTVTSTASNPEVVVGGTATAPAGIATVTAQVTDTTTGLTYNAVTDELNPQTAWSPCPYWGPSPSVTWRITDVLTVPGDAYTVKVRATDRAGNVSAVATANL